MNNQPPVNIFAKIMGQQYLQLPEIIQEFHNTPCVLWEGFAQAGGSNSFIANLIRKIMGFPKPADKLPVKVTVYYTDQGHECWVRNFGDSKFSSILSIDKKNPQQLSEKMGLINQHFKLEIIDNWLCWKLQYCTLFGIKLPTFLTPKIIANEGVTEDNTYQFVAKATFPLIGVLVDYKGSLTQAT